MFFRWAYPFLTLCAVELIHATNWSPLVRRIEVYAAAMADAGKLNDVLTISLSYENGSIGSISYFANGDKSLAKERVEIYANGNTAVLDDFKTLTIHANGKKKQKTSKKISSYAQKSTTQQSGLITINALRGSFALKTSLSSLTYSCGRMTLGRNLLTVRLSFGITKRIT